jgi:hypothetical protein
VISHCDLSLIARHRIYNSIEKKPNTHPTLIKRMIPSFSHTQASYRAFAVYRTGLSLWNNGTSASRRLPNAILRSSSNSSKKSEREAQRAAYEYYRKKQEAESFFFTRWLRQRRQRSKSKMTLQEKNYRVAWYMAAVVVGAGGATYAAVPLFKRLALRVPRNAFKLYLPTRTTTTPLTMMTVPLRDCKRFGIR